MLPKRLTPSSIVRVSLTALIVLLLAGCQASDYMLLFPAGEVGTAQRNLIVFTVLLLAFVFVPVVSFTLFFAWRYRASNTKARYSPKWDHSKLLEAFLWGGPIVIVAILATATWITTYELDPYDSIKPADAPTLKVRAISLDWKWLFIYPKYDVASIGELALPVDRPVSIMLTSDTAMTAFMVPALGSQIFVMNGMVTNLHYLPREIGNYLGRNYQYIGEHYHDMIFRTKVMSMADFKGWVEQAKAKGTRLDELRYAKLAEPSDFDRVAYFSPIKDHLFRFVIGLYNDGTPRNRFTRAANVPYPAERS